MAGHGQVSRPGRLPPYHRAKGYVVLPPGTPPATLKPQAAPGVYFRPGFDADGRAVAAALGIDAAR